MFARITASPRPRQSVAVRPAAWIVVAFLLAGARRNKGTVGSAEFLGHIDLCNRHGAY